MHTSSTFQHHISVLSLEDTHIRTWEKYRKKKMRSCSVALLCRNINVWEYLGCPWVCKCMSWQSRTALFHQDASIEEAAFKRRLEWNHHAHYCKLVSCFTKQPLLLYHIFLFTQIFSSWTPTTGSGVEIGAYGIKRRNSCYRNGQVILLI